MSKCLVCPLVWETVAHGPFKSIQSLHQQKLRHQQHIQNLIVKIFKGVKYQLKWSKRVGVAFNMCIEPSILWTDRVEDDTKTPGHIGRWENSPAWLETFAKRLCVWKPIYESIISLPFLLRYSFYYFFSLNGLGAVCIATPTAGEESCSAVNDVVIIQMAQQAGNVKRKLI